MNPKNPSSALEDSEQEPLQAKDHHSKDHGLEIHSPSPKSKKNPRDTKLRWLVLILSVATTYGGYFCNDNPQALQTAIQSTFNIQNTQFNMLYSMTILPNVVVPFIGGIATDYFGVGFTMIIAGALLLIGQMVVALGALITSFPVMIIGRITFGSGFQTMENTLLIMISKWFLDKEFSFAWGFARLILRTATALNSFMTPALYKWTNNILTPLMLGVMLDALSLICTFIVVSIDKKIDKESKDEEDESNKNTQKISFSEIKNLPKIYFIMMAAGVFVYAAFYGFTNNVNNFMVDRFGFTSEEAGLLIMIIYLVSGVLSPFVGLLIDRVGKRLVFLFTAGVVFLCSHALFLFLQDRSREDPNYGVIYGLVGLGIFYALFSPSYWTSLPMIVTPEAFGVGVGLVTSAIAITEAIYTELVGVIHDHTTEDHKGYYWTQVSHCLVVCSMIVFTGWAYFLDIKGKGVLNKPRQKREEKTD